MKKIFTLDEIKQIRLNWDFENAIFPKSVIRSFSYTYQEDKNEHYQHSLYTSEIYLEVDLDYVMKENGYFDNEKQKNQKIISLLDSHNVWYIALTVDGKEIELEVPDYSKERYLGGTLFNTENVFETHTKTESSYIIKWKEDKEKTKLTMEEMHLVFQKEIEHDITYRFFQMEALMSLLENSDSFFHQFSTISHGYIRIKPGYQLIGETKENRGLKQYILHIKNHSYCTDIRYIFVKKIEEDLLQLLRQIKETKASTHDTQKTIFVLDCSLNIEDFENLLREVSFGAVVTSLEEMNDIWYQFVRK